MFNGTQSFLRGLQAGFVSFGFSPNRPLKVETNPVVVSVEAAWDDVGLALTDGLKQVKMAPHKKAKVEKSDAKKEEFVCQ